MTPLQLFAVLVCGALFGFGLTLSTMVQPQSVLNFLRFRDAGLMLVLGGAVVVTLFAYQGIPSWFHRPLLGGHFGQHEARLDRDTVVGSAIFGVGWGLCGVCPGPAIAALGTGNLDLLWALAGILLGAGIQGWVASRRTPGQP